MTSLPLCEWLTLIIHKTNNKMNTTSSGMKASMGKNFSQRRTYIQNVV